MVGFTSIKSGTGYDSSTWTITGEKDFFNFGEIVYVLGRATNVNLDHNITIEARWRLDGVEKSKSTVNLVSGFYPVFAMVAWWQVPQIGNWDVVFINTTDAQFFGSKGFVVQAVSKDISANIQIKNTGNTISNFAIDYSVDGVRRKETTIISLSPNSMQTISFPDNVTFGSHEFQARVGDERFINIFDIKKMTQVI